MGNRTRLPPDSVQSTSIEGCMPMSQSGHRGLAGRVAGGGAEPGLQSVMMCSFRIDCIDRVMRKF
jgi:hypothetical protein